MDKIYKTDEKDKLNVLRNKKPFYDEDSKAYWLDFDGRVKEPSVKNFQLVMSDNPDDVIIQFGRVRPGIFHLDFKAPLTAVQAFGICLSSLSHKLAGK